MAYILLEDGTYFEGTTFGAQLKEPVTGEIVFCTGMTGYLEVLTDPSYCGQIITMTYPLIGNYGVNREDRESNCVAAKAMVVYELCDEPSNWFSNERLEDFMRDQGVVGVQAVDTRALTKKIRTHGTMAARIQNTPPTQADYQSLQGVTTKRPILQVTCKEPYTMQPEQPKHHVAVLDFGIKAGMLRGLVQKGCKVTVLPALTPPEEILKGGYDGVMLSNGPGDPKDNPDIVENIKELMGELPIMGICMGHQLMALARGCDTSRLKYGHRGGNHPVKDLKTQRVYITSQNHGYAVDADTVKEGIVTHINMNDGTVEGVAYPAYRAFGVQFHPEASPGPVDTGVLFDQFIAMMEE